MFQFQTYSSKEEWTQQYTLFSRIQKPVLGKGVSCQSFPSHPAPPLIPGFRQNFAFSSKIIVKVDSICSPLAFRITSRHAKSCKRACITTQKNKFGLKTIAMPSQFILLFQQCFSLLIACKLRTRHAYYVGIKKRKICFFLPGIRCLEFLLLSTRDSAA